MSKTEGTLYIVAHKSNATDGATVGKERFDRAFRESTALKHVAQDTLVVRKATVVEALRLGREGVTEEDARREEPAVAPAGAAQ